MYCISLFLRIGELLHETLRYFVPGLDAFYQKKQGKQENKKIKNIIDMDVGMKKADKQEVIQDERRFGVLYPFLNSTSKYYVATCVIVWNVGVGRELQISLHPE